MKTIGIIGGLGPESTLYYYDGIIKSFEQPGQSYDYPEVFIHSLNLGQVWVLMEAGDWDAVADILVQSIEVLQAAGADFAAIASNTPHLAFDAVKSRIELPLISIIEATAQRAASLGLRTPGLLGTSVTMKSDLYQSVFGGLSMKVPVPAEEDQELIQQRLFSEIEKGIIKDSTREELLDIVRRMKAKHGIDALILGCTELPLILDQPEYEDLPVLNASAIHVEAIVDHCRREGP